jgi:hypothetical protein
MTNWLHRYSSQGHRRVQGWLTDTAIALIGDIARIQRAHDVAGPVCEIGVHHGRLFILLHHLTNPRERAVGWDLFEHQEQNVDRSGKGDRARLMINLQRHGADMSRIAVHTANSLDLTPAAIVEACGAPPRIFSVDGGHTPEITESDLRLAAGSIHEEGVIILDDFFNETWPGVAEGACRYMGAGAPLIPVAIGGNKFIFARSVRMAELYRNQLALPTPRFRRRDTVAFGQPVAVYTVNRTSWRTRLLRTPAMRLLRRSVPWRLRRLTRQ